MSKIVLASTSPRRKELLGRYIENIEMVKPDMEEKIDNNSNPAVQAMSLSYQKAISVENKLEKGTIVVGSDTIVVYDNNILGKPSSKEDAYNTLKSLSGNTHRVISGISVIEVGTNKKIVDYEVTEVKFRELDDATINKYIETEEPMDKAGSYGIQSIGQILVSEISGSYANVVGLPIVRLDDILRRYFNLKIF